MNEIEELKEKIDNLLRKQFYLKEQNGEFYGSLYVDYRDELCDETVKKILNSENPRDSFYEVLFDMEIDASTYEYDYIENELFKSLTDEEKDIFYGEDLRTWLFDHVHFSYDEEDWDKELEVNLMVDTGDSNYDFACNNTLSWYGNHTTDFDERSSIKWLAKQQRRYTLLKKTIKERYGSKAKDDNDFTEEFPEVNKFVDTTIEELINNSHCCCVLTFMPKMSLLELIDLKEYIKNNPEGYITISKDTDCGLFAPFVGGGSLLSICLEKDVKLPNKFVYDIYMDGMKNHGYDIGEVYGMCSSAWKGTIRAGKVA